MPTPSPTAAPTKAWATVATGRRGGGYYIGGGTLAIGSFSAAGLGQVHVERRCTAPRRRRCSFPQGYALGRFEPGLCPRQARPGADRPGASCHCFRTRCGRSTGLSSFGGHRMTAGTLSSIEALPSCQSSIHLLPISQALRLPVAVPGCIDLLADKSACTSILRAFATRSCLHC